jgi:alanine dehydrogenase
MDTLILTRAEVADAMNLADWLAAVETGFVAAARGAAVSPPPMHIHGEGGGFHAKGASLRLDRHYVAVKLNGNFPGNPARGLPAIQGAIFLCDGADGRLLAVLDSIEVTLRRTAAATALAARYLARADSSAILVCGCGEQGRAQLEALASILPLRRCFAWDTDADRARLFAAEMAPRLGIDVAPAGLASAAEADVIVTCTPATAPFLSKPMVRPGTFVAAVGADSPAKNELDPDLFSGTHVVADVLDQCREMGDLHHAIAAGTIQAADVHAELADLVSGARNGRSSADETTIYDSTGTALQDVAAAAFIYERCAGAGAARTVDFGSF